MSELTCFSSAESGQARLICYTYIYLNLRGFAMPTISMFYGIIIRMLFMDTQQHNLPHLHVEYQGQKASISIPDGNILEGDFPAKKLRMVQAWIAIHEDELMADWELAVSGETPYKIAPL